MDLVTERPERFFYTERIPTFTNKNARLARTSFEAFRKTIHPDMLWNPFVLRITRELQRFGDALEDASPAPQADLLAIGQPPSSPRAVTPPACSGASTARRYGGGARSPRVACGGLR